ncbi:DsrE family protein [uncultured Kriegella sp.]|uniref:DsrE family protein n=1 Tax=uncultured Kriegella sp. TaxID=1798910 RepID=UPI0030DA94F1|tara:strand:- start:48138 stop:48689 length:552 start_codon:yes stop_codon:yes gene_type:complete
MHKTALKSNFITLIFLGLMAHSLAQTKKSGPIIADYGSVWKVDKQDFKVNTTKTYRVVFDVSYSPNDKSQLNASIETAARFLNMHAQNGVPLNQLKVALVVHGKAAKDLLLSEAYIAKCGVENPNEELLNDLMHVGVDVVLCGQTFSSNGFLKEDLINGVQLSLSAMTALIQLQDDNYRLIKF